MILTECSETFKEWLQDFPPGNAVLNRSHLKYSAMLKLGMLLLDGEVGVLDKDEEEEFVKIGIDLKGGFALHRDNDDVVDGATNPPKIDNLHELHTLWKAPDENAPNTSKSVDQVEKLREKEALFTMKNGAVCKEGKIRKSGSGRWRPPHGMQDAKMFFAGSSTEDTFTLLPFPRQRYPLHRRQAENVNCKLAPMLPSSDETRSEMLNQKCLLDDDRMIVEVDPTYVSYDNIE